MKRDSGFTLMELMVVIAIIGVLAGVAIPSFVAYRSNQRLGASAREILGAMKDARMAAIRTQQRILLTFDVVGGSYVAFVDDGEGTPDSDDDGIGDGADNNTYDVGEDVMVRGILPSDIEMINASFAPGGVPRAEFNSRGMAPGFGGNVVLRNARGYTQTITLRVTGNANVR